MNMETINTFVVQRFSLGGEWLDAEDSSTDLGNAEYDSEEIARMALERLRAMEPERRFRLVARTTCVTDEVLENG